MSEIDRAQAQRDGLLKPMRPGNQAAGSGLSRSEPVSGMSEIELPEATARVRRWTTNSVTVDIPPHLLAGLSDGDALYTDEQVRQLIAAERERCARVCDGLKVAAASYFEINERLDEATAAIRRGSV